ncbi:hypothetical protein F2S75_04595, partial [Pseudomonas syringae pv. actinidiae]|nr:hypothetical protein [Pseudomonas syringae pv. actinidiae]
YTFSTLASGRIMASWLLRESGAQHPGSVKRFECGVYGAVTFDQQFVSDGLSVEPPRCPRCNGKLRPGVVWFGEDLPIAVWKRAVGAAQGCDVLLSIGTSGVVFPAAEIPRIALKSGARVVHINTTETPLESPLEMSLIGRAAVCVPAIVSQIAAPGKVV